MKKIIIAVTTALTMTLAGCAEPETPESRFIAKCSKKLEDSMKNPSSYKLIESEFINSRVFTKEETKQFIENNPKDLYDFQIEYLSKYDVIESHVAQLTIEGTNSFGAVIRSRETCVAWTKPDALQDEWQSDTIYTMKILN